MPTPFSRTTRSLVGDGGRYALVAWALAGIALAAWVAWFVFGRVTVFEVSRSARLEVSQAAHPVSALLSGRVVATSLALGSDVRAGDVLVELDAAAERLRVREEQARLHATEAQTAALRQEIAARIDAGRQDRDAAAAAVQGARFRAQEAAAGAAYATENERRLREESGAGGVAPIEALQARAEMQKLSAASGALAAEARRIEADAALRGAQQRGQLDALERTLASLQGDAAAAGAAVARLQLEIDQHRLRAPVAGRIGDVAPLRVGDVVAAGQKFATIVPAGALIVVAEFDPATVLGRVRPGQPARLRLDGFPWAQYGTVAAVVSRVGSEIRDGRVRVELTPQGALPAGVDLQHGLPGAVEISVERVAPALLVLRASGQRLSSAAGRDDPEPAVPPVR